MTLLGSDEELSDISSVSSSEDSSEEEEEDDDEELIDKDLRKQQKKSIFGFQVKDKQRKGGQDRESNNRGEDADDLNLPKPLNDVDSDEDSPNSEKKKFHRIA